MHKKVTKRKHLNLNLMIHLKGAFVSAIKDATDYSSEETLKIVLRYLCKDTKTAFEVKIKGTI